MTNQMKNSANFNKERYEKNDPRARAVADEFLRKYYNCQEVVDANAYTHDLECEFPDIGRLAIECEIKLGWLQPPEKEEKFAVYAKRGKGRKLTNLPTLHVLDRKRKKVLELDEDERDHIPYTYYFIISYHENRLAVVDEDRVKEAEKSHKCAVLDDDGQNQILYDLYEVPVKECAFFKKINDKWKEDKVNGKYAK